MYTEIDKNHTNFPGDSTVAIQSKANKLVSKFQSNNQRLDLHR